uniref:Serpin domain-containing protein n=1 Tax=Panagrolaimus sp. ES5 TaxID=591445 RepID=A0AC34F1U0_9BILA
MSVKSEIEFSIKILKTTNTEKSIVYSPFSILNNLAILYAGSDGKTAEQLSQFLGGGKSNDEAIQHYFDLIKYCKTVSGNESGNFQLSSSNCLFVSDEPMLPNFTAIMDKFDVKFQKLDFKETKKSAKEINQFISQNTNEKIENIVAESDIVKDANLFIVNALYFFGKWETPFNEISSIFRGQKAKMLQRTVKNEGWNLVENEKWQCLGIPFKNQKCWLHILLPTEGENLSELIQNFNEDLFKECVFKNNVSKVEVLIPKFLLESKILLDEVLKKLGVTGIFEFGNVRKIFAEPHSVDKFLHFTKFEINKFGAEAASASIIPVVPVCFESDMHYFFAINPFIYFITLVDDGSSDVKSILLMGQYWGDKKR